MVWAMDGPGWRELPDIRKTKTHNGGSLAVVTPTGDGASPTSHWLASLKKNARSRRPRGRMCCPSLPSGPSLITANGWCRSYAELASASPEIRCGLTCERDGLSHQLRCLCMWMSSSTLTIARPPTRLRGRHRQRSRRSSTGALHRRWDGREDAPDRLDGRTRYRC